MPLDSSLIPNLTPAERQEVDLRQGIAEAALREQAEAQRQAWLERRRADVRAKLGAKAQVSDEDLTRAVTDHVLAPDFVLHVELVRHSGVTTAVTVAEVQANPHRYNGCRTKDPVDPEHDDGALKGMLLLNGRVPRLKSFRGGELDYTLEARQEIVVCEPGGTRETTLHVLTKMRQGGQFFDRGSRLAIIQDNLIQDVTVDLLGFHLARTFQFVKEVATRGGTKIVFIDPPPAVLKQIIALAVARGLLPVDALVTSPIVRADGTLVQTPGHDAPSRLFLAIDRADVPEISSHPSRQQARRALRMLEALLKHFRFATPADRTAAFCAILTAVIRPALDQAPAIIADAPDAGSAKTAFAQGLGALNLGIMPGISPAVAVEDETEGKKFVTAQLISSSSGVLIFDNVAGEVTNRVLCALLTSPFWSDRILGETRLEQMLLVKTLLILTGTNLTFSKELARRTLPCRLLPQDPSAAPVKAFAKVILEHRGEVVWAALTLIRAALTSEEPRAPGQTTSFAEWDLLVRQTIAWVGTHLEPGSLIDPIRIVETAKDRAFDKMGEAEILTCLFGIYGNEPFRAAELAADLRCERNETRRSVLLSLTRGNAQASSGSVGKYLASIRDRPVAGLTLRAFEKGSVNCWHLEGKPTLSEGIEQDGEAEGTSSAPKVGSPTARLSGSRSNQAKEQGGG